MALRGSANLFLVGMPRSGTTQLYTYFRQHPEVFVPWVKEIQFFGRDLDVFSRMRPRAYAALFAAGARFGWRLDASTASLYSVYAASEMLVHAPQGRIIIGLREPEAWLASMYGVLAQWREEERPFAQAVLPGRCTRAQAPRAGCLNYLQYWENLMELPEQVQRFVAVFGRERVFIYAQEELAREPENVCRRLCEWLSIAPLPPLAGKRNARGQLHYWPRIPEWLSGRQRRRAVEWLLAYAPPLARPAYALYRPVRALLLRTLNGTAPQHCPLKAEPLNPQQREALQQMRQRLEAVCGVSFAKWWD